MSFPGRSIWPAAGAALLLPYVVCTEEPPPLAHDPFSRPPSEVTAEERSLLDSGAGSGLTPDLKATLVGNSDRLANVAGRVLRPGDDILGYRLIEVYEDRAVFVRDGKPLTVYVKPHLVDDDE